MTIFATPFLTVKKMSSTMQLDIVAYARKVFQVIPCDLANSSTTLAVNQDELSLTIEPGAPNLCSILFSVNPKNVIEVASFVELEIGQLVRCSTQTRMNRFTSFAVGKGPAKSMENTSKRRVKGRYRLVRYRGTSGILWKGS